MEEPISLTASEWRVMEALWDRGGQTIAQLTAALEGETGWGKHTVISFLNRMEKKGAVTYHEAGRARVYQPACPRQEARRQEAQRFLDRVFAGSLGGLVSTMVDAKGLSEEDVRTLMDILDRAEGGSGRDRP